MSLITCRTSTSFECLGIEHAYAYNVKGRARDREKKENRER